MQTISCPCSGPGFKTQNCNQAPNIFIVSTPSEAHEHSALLHTAFSSAAHCIHLCCTLHSALLHTALSSAAHCIQLCCTLLSFSTQLPDLWLSPVRLLVQWSLISCHGAARTLFWCGLFPVLALFSLLPGQPLSVPVRGTKPWSWSEN